jgi:hypothetical protein
MAFAPKAAAVSSSQRVAERVGTKVMPAKAIITRASFGPEAVKVMTKAFDDAWREIEDHFTVMLRPQSKRALSSPTPSCSTQRKTAATPKL